MRGWYHRRRLSDYQDRHLTVIVPTWVVRGIAVLEWLTLALQGLAAPGLHGLAQSCPFGIALQIAPIAPLVNVVLCTGSVAQSCLSPESRTDLYIFMRYTVDAIEV